jgi:hypothetical protein
LAGGRGVSYLDHPKHSVIRRRLRGSLEDMGKARSKELEFVERQTTAASAKKALMERFRAKAADPATAEAAQQRAAEAAERAVARQAREGEKAERKAREAERKAREAEEAAAQAILLAKEMADREVAREAAAKADRDARYARRKEKASKKARS